MTAPRSLTWAEYADWAKTHNSTRDWPGEIGEAIEIELPSDDEGEASDALCCDCGEPLVTDEGDPRACHCEREAEGEARWETDDER